MRKFFVLFALLLTACGTYNTQKNGDLVTVTVDGVHDPMFVYMKAKEACPRGRELLSEGVDNDGLTFFKFKCL